MDKQQLKQNYENACNAYLKAFCDKHDFDSSYWIGGIVGGVADFDGFYTVGFDDIKADVDSGVDKHEFEKWYEYCLQIGGLNINIPNFNQWIHGCYRTPQSTIVTLLKMRKRFENAINEENERVKKENEDNKF